MTRVIGVIYFILRTENEIPKFKKNKNKNKKTLELSSLFHREQISMLIYVSSLPTVMSPIYNC